MTSGVSTGAMAGRAKRRWAFSTPAQAIDPPPATTNSTITHSMSAASRKVSGASPGATSGR